MMSSIAWWWRTKKKKKDKNWMCNIFEKRDLTDTFCAQYIYLKQSYNSKSCVAKFREFTGFSIFRRLPGIFVGCEVVHLTQGKFSGKNICLVSHTPPLMPVSNQIGLTTPGLCCTRWKPIFFAQSRPVFTFSRDTCDSPIWMLQTIVIDWCIRLSWVYLGLVGPGWL